MGEDILIRMYSKLKLVLKYLQYYLKASNGKGHGIHSPFVFEFITKVLNDKTDYPAYHTVENLRKKLLVNETVLTIEDYGAGSAASKTNQRTIASIAANAAKPALFGQLFYRIINKYQPRTIIELGTSLGVTTSYLSLARPDAKIFTLEGASSIAEKASNNFKSIGLQNIELIEGNFDNTLPLLLQKIQSVDFAFIDGNHRYEPTVSYFNQLLLHIHNDSILVFDDIHWSKEMEQVWEAIKNNEKVRCTIDLFFIGIVFFRQEFREKQNFAIRF